MTTPPARITATQADPTSPGPEDWRPTPAANVEAKERAQFLADWNDGDDTAAPAADEPDDGDEDLDEDEDDDIEEKPSPPKKKPAAPVAKKAAAAEEPADPDDDSDLDDDEDDEDKPAADPAIAKGLVKLQKQEQRMRQQFDRERADFTKERDSFQAERTKLSTEAAEARSKYERLMSRAKSDPAGVLEELGVDDWDYTAKQTFTRSKAGADPANKEAAARLQSEREHRAKLAELEKKLADRDKSEEESRKQAEGQRQVDAYLSSVVKAVPTFTKATLVQKMIAADPDYARRQIAAAAHRIYQGGESYPDAKAVIVEVEKAERALLRRYGINPRSLAATPDQPTNGTSTKPSNGANGKAKKRADDDELKMPSREELLAEDWPR